MIGTCTVLIATYRRADHLAGCLWALSSQTRPPDQVVVAWQGDDTATRDRVHTIQREGTPFRLDLAYSGSPNITAAENAALAIATGDVILLIDDDARAPPNWVERHLEFYSSPTVGAVGGPADNFDPQRVPYPRRAVEPVGRLTVFGRLRGNMHDQAPEWRARTPIEVDHLVGNNMSLRRVAFDRFIEGLRGYSQLFELDACLQVRSRGYRVLFDFGNVVEHHPRNTAFAGGRDGDLDLKIFGPAYNHARVIAIHSTMPLWLLRVAFALLVGNTSTPGVIGALVCATRFGRPGRELRILGRTALSVLAGARDGRRDRQSRV